MKMLKGFRRQPWTFWVFLPCLLALLVLASLQTAWAQGALTVRLSWKIKGEFAPLIVAQERGYFAQEGLNVRVEEGAGAKSAIQTVVAGKDQVAYISALALAKVVDRNVPVKMVANYVKRLPMGVASHPDIPLRTPKDMEGKRIAASPGDSFVSILPTFAKINNVDINKIEVVHLTWGVRIPSFMRRETQLISIYLTNDLPLLESKMGVKLNTLVAYDWGYDILGHGLVAANAYIQKNPDVVRRIVRAATKGFRDAINNPKEAAEILVKRFPAVLSKILVEKQIRINNRLLESKASKGKPLGWQAKEDWERTISTFERTGEIKSRKALPVYYSNTYVLKQ